MKSQPFLRDHNEFTISFKIWLWIHFLWIHYLLHYEFFLFRDLIHYQFPYCLWVHYLFRELTMNWLSFSRIHYGLAILFEIWLWIDFQIINSTINSLSLPPIHGELTIFSQIHNEFDYKFTIKFRIWLGIHYLFREFISIRRFSRFYVDLQCISCLLYQWTMGQ